MVDQDGIRYVNGYEKGLENLPKITIGIYVGGPIRD